MKKPIIILIIGIIVAITILIVNNDNGKALAKAGN